MLEDVIPAGCGVDTSPSGLADLLDVLAAALWPEDRAASEILATAGEQLRHLRRGGRRRAVLRAAHARRVW